MIIEGEGAGYEAEHIRTFETLPEKLDFIKTRFVDETLPIKATVEVAENGEDIAEVEFHGDLFDGEITEDISMQIKETLGVDLAEDGNFKLTGEFELVVYEIPKTQIPTYLLVREIEGQSEVLFYEEALLEMFEEIEGLQRVSVSGNVT